MGEWRGVKELLECGYYVEAYRVMKEAADDLDRKWILMTSMVCFPVADWWPLKGRDALTKEGGVVDSVLGFFGVR